MWGRPVYGNLFNIPADWLDFPLRQGFGFSFLLHTEIWTQVETRFQNGELEKVDSSVHANTNVPALYIQANDAGGSVNTIVTHCESHNIFSPSTIAHEIRKCVLYMVHIGICSLCKKLPWAPWMLQELWTERSAAVTAPSSPQTNKFRGAKGMKTLFFFVFFFFEPGGVFIKNVICSWPPSQLPLTVCRGSAEVAVAMPEWQER